MEETMITLKLTDNKNNKHYIVDESVDICFWNFLETNSDILEKVQSKYLEKLNSQNKLNYAIAGVDKHESERASVNNQTSK